ncbi:hypothetical protein ACJX0J_032397 [Zea mays]
MESDGALIGWRETRRCINLILIYFFIYASKTNTAYKQKTEGVGLFGWVIKPKKEIQVLPSLNYRLFWTFKMIAVATQLHPIGRAREQGLLKGSLLKAIFIYYYIIHFCYILDERFHGLLLYNQLYYK